LGLQGTGWSLSSGSKPESAKVAGLLTSYQEVRVSGFADKSQQDSLSKAKPRRSSRLLDRKGNPLLSMAFDSSATGFWVRVNGAATRGTPTGWDRLESWTSD